MREGKRDGRGITVTTERDVEIAHYRNGDQEGEYVRILRNGNKEIGCTLNGKQHGKLVMVYSTSIARFCWKRSWMLPLSLSRPETPPGIS